MLLTRCSPSSRVSSASSAELCGAEGTGQRRDREAGQGGARATRRGGTRRGEEDDEGSRVGTDVDGTLLDGDHGGVGLVDDIVGLGELRAARERGQELARRREHLRTSGQRTS